MPREGSPKFKQKRFFEIPFNSIGRSHNFTIQKNASLSIVPVHEPQENIHTVSLYIGAPRQEPYFDYIVNLNPKRVIFNPGTENPIFAQKLQEKGIPWENACTLVLLSTNQYKS